MPRGTGPGSTCPRLRAYRGRGPPLRHQIVHADYFPPRRVDPVQEVGSRTSRPRASFFFPPGDRVHGSVRGPRTPGARSSYRFEPLLKRGSQGWTSPPTAPSANPSPLIGCADSICTDQHGPGFQPTSASPRFRRSHFTATSSFFSFEEKERRTLNKEEADLIVLDQDPSGPHRSHSGSKVRNNHHWRDESSTMGK